ncbi:hypothetical protein [Nocardioides sp.]|uniref:hypothetical protein n=1 Tax=Nocardioides sp. TaxID=35761 RepID=UPI0039E392B2
MAISTDQELRRIRQMPYGVARTAATEAITRKVEAEGPEHLLAEALLDLVEVYTFTGEGSKSFVVFARLLRLWDERPELFDEQDARNLFWEFKWVAADLSEYAEITVVQAEAFLADMRRRFDLAGKGTSSVAMSEFRWAWHAGLPTMEETRIAWQTQPRDEFDDCQACLTGHHVDYFTELGRYEEAIAAGQQLSGSCNQEPMRTLHALALAAIQAGQPELATRSYLRALASLDGAEGSDFAPAKGQGFATLAIGGEIERALRTLREDHAPLLLRASTPLFRLRFLLGVLAGLSANLDRGELPTGLRTPAAPTLADLHRWVETEASTLAARFDRRNGTDYYARLIARALATTRAPQPLELGVSGRPVVTGDPGSGAEGTTAAAEAGSTAAEPTAADPVEGLTAEQRYARGEMLAGQRAWYGAAEEYLAAARLGQEEGLLELSGVAWAESARCVQELQDDAAAHERYREAIPRLRAAGVGDTLIGQVLTAWAPVAARMRDPAELIDQLRQLLDRLADDSSGEELTEERQQERLGARASARDTLARAIGADPSPDRDLGRAITEALLAGEEFARLGLVSDASHAFWLAGRLQREEGDTEGAVWSLESAFEGFGMARDRQRRAEAAGDLIELLRASGRPERADEIVALLGR